MIEKVLQERGNRYGTFADHAKICQSLLDTIRAQPNWEKMQPDAKQAVSVICDKLARMMNGDPEYDDNWVDIIGYSTLVLNRIKADERDKSVTPEDSEKASSIPMPEINPRGGELSWVEPGYVTVPFNGKPSQYEHILSR